MGIVDSDMCTFCKLIKEDVEHLFFHCPFSSSFWTDFEAFWSSNMNETINLSLQDIIVGINNEKSKFLNYCILVGKSTIFQAAKLIRSLVWSYLKLSYIKSILLSYLLLKSVIN